MFIDGTACLLPAERYIKNIIDTLLIDHLAPDRSVEFFAIDVSGNEHSFWPLLGDYATSPDTRLAGIIMRLDIAPFGVVERLWAVPGA